MERMSKQLVLSGKLKPEARLGLEISNFAQSLDDERRKEFRRMQTARSTQISGSDVIKVTEEINQEGARHHRTWRTHGTKVGGFLSRIQTLASIGDVLIGGSQNLIATGVWSAVRMSLTIATNYMGYFEKLSTLFMRLGTSWALHEDFAQLFPRSEILQTYFCEYLVVLMKLCNKIVVFSQKSTGVQLLSSIGSSFDSEFGNIQKELDQWGCLIQQQCQLLAMKTVTGAENSRSHGLKQRILRRLSPKQSDFETRWRRQRKKGTCEWIFDTPEFKKWRSMQTSTTLCISGKLGSGKTVSMANIVARTNLEQACAHAFCASQEPTSLKATSVLGSIAFNLLDHLPPEAIARRNAKRFNSVINTFEPESIIDFLLGLLPVVRTYIIIVDGLENCPDADITDVLSGLRRLQQDRVTLLCYSSRSDSRFHHITKQYLAPRFLISHDDFNHDAELESYIMKEVTRRNAAGHLSPEIEDLVKKQLILGAQGMYLWASLQLDTIFPANSNVVVTDDHALNLISHLPKDLPEAFERALEGISDRQYEGRIMKLVMSAVTPLSLDEIRVSLSIVLGEPIWQPEKAAKDGTQLISLCGGNLLDLDEEDGKIRFIHHSVIQHLLSPAANESTAPYHFSAEDAESFIGAICVTYLNLPVLDKRLTMTGNVQSLDMLDNVVRITQNALPGVSRLVQHIRSREQKRARPSHFDIGHVLSQMQAAHIQPDLDPGCFAPYATSHWLFHTRFFDENIQHCQDSWRLWWRLLNGGVNTVEPPFAGLEREPCKALLWAVENAHGSLFRNILAKCGLPPSQLQVAEVVRALELHKSIRGQWLGDLLAWYLLTSHSAELPSSCDAITSILDLGADPAALHSISQSSSIEILIDRICTEDFRAEDEQKLTHGFFSHPSVQKAFGDKSLLIALETLLKRARTVAITEILAWRPDLEFRFHQIQAREGTTAVDEALKYDRWEKMDVLAIPSLVNSSMFSGTSLLWKAIERKSDSWVYRLLRDGADPNIGPFTMEHHIDISGFVATCFPIEAALWLRRTRVCLELLDHGADLDLVGASLIRIARKTENSIISARLDEISGRSGQEEQTAHRSCHGHDRTALATACKMLSHTDPSEPVGFPRPLSDVYATEYWTSELQKIIQVLARNAHAEYVNDQDSDGRTALHYLLVANRGFIGDPGLGKLVELLLQLGADPNLPDCHGETSLWLAISNSAPIDLVIEPLLKASPGPNAANISHNSSVIKEAMMEYEGTEEDSMKLVRLLLQVGAELNSMDLKVIASATGKDVESLMEDLKGYTYMG